MADMKITLEGIDSEEFLGTAKQVIDNDNDYNLSNDSERIAVYDDFFDTVNIDDNTVTIRTDYDAYAVSVIYDTLQHVDFLRASIESSDFKTLIFDDQLDFLTLLGDFFTSYGDISGEYDHAFIWEYLEENKELPEHDLHVVSLGKTNRDAQLENFGLYLWEHYLDFRDRLESADNLSEIMKYIKIDYVSLARDFIKDWEETGTYAYKSM